MLQKILFFSTMFGLVVRYFINAISEEIFHARRLRLSQMSYPMQAILDELSQISDLKSAISNQRSQINDLRSAISDQLSQISYLKSAISDQLSQISYLGQAHRFTEARGSRASRLHGHLQLNQRLLCLVPGYLQG